MPFRVQWSETCTEVRVGSSPASAGQMPGSNPLEKMLASSSMADRAEETSIRRCSSRRCPIGENKIRANPIYSLLSEIRVFPFWQQQRGLTCTQPIYLIVATASKCYYSVRGGNVPIVKENRGCSPSSRPHRLCAALLAYSSTHRQVDALILMCARSHDLGHLPQCFSRCFDVVVLSIRRMYHRQTASEECQDPGFRWCCTPGGGRLPQQHPPQATATSIGRLRPCFRLQSSAFAIRRFAPTTESAATSKRPTTPLLAAAATSPAHVRPRGQLLLQRLGSDIRLRKEVTPEEHEQ